MGTLYVVGTPIGNLKDITLRALETLRSVSLIAAEDTRVTRKLLDAYDIHTPMTSYFEHNKLQKIGRILDALDHGDVALVSDAGMPGINDPGYELIRACLDAGHRVTVVPGPSAPIAALVISGLPTDRFLYLGYVPRRSQERRKAFQHLRYERSTLIFLEVPHRLVNTLVDAVEIFGDDRACAIARELTKVHEEVFRGTLRDALEHFRLHPPRGELVLIVQGSPDPAPEHHIDVARVREAAKLLADAGLSPSQTARVLARLLGISKRTIYAYLTSSTPPEDEDA